MTLARLAKSRYDETKRLWALSCEYDGIDPESKFVVFSDDNPYVKVYNEMLKLYQETAAKSQVVK